MTAFDTDAHDAPATDPGAAGAAAAPLARLGLRIRHARMLHGLTLKALAEAAQCSESLLSRVERSQATPSLATLHRLAAALGTNVAELTLAEAPVASPITRAGERTVLHFGSQRAGRPGIRLERVLMPVRGQLLQADIHVLDAGAASLEAISHAGEEIGYVIEGELELRLGDAVHRLGPGDTFHFPSDTPHSYLNPGATVTRVLWVNTPATF
jgi:transcriptional regulator with XRE-family HTH domain